MLFIKSNSSWWTINLLIFFIEFFIKLDWLIFKKNYNNFIFLYFIFFYFINFFFMKFFNNLNLLILKKTITIINFKIFFFYFINFFSWNFSLILKIQVDGLDEICPVAKNSRHFFIQTKIKTLPSREIRSNFGDWRSRFGRLISIIYAAPITKASTGFWWLHTPEIIEQQHLLQVSR